MKDRDRGNSDTAVPSIMRASRYRRDQRQLDEDEEMWLNDEEESYEEETTPVGRSQIAEQMQISQSHTAAVRADEDSAAEDRNSDGKYERTFSPEYDPPDSPNGTAESSEACEGELSPGDGSDAQPPLEAHASAKLGNKKGLVDYDVDSEEEEEESSLSDSGEESSPRAGTSSGSVATDDAVHNGSSLDGTQSADDVKTTIQHNGELIPSVSDDNDNATPALSSEELAQLNTDNESKDESGDLKRKSLDDEPPQTEVEATTESTRKMDREGDVEDEIESDAKRQRLE